MNVKTMQRVDYWVGVPLCAVLSIVSSIWGLLLRKTAAPQVPKRFLFIELSEMGSAIIAAPMLQRVKERYADAEVHFLIFNRNVESIEIPGVVARDRTHVIKDTSLCAFLFSTLAVLWHLRQLKFDVIIDMELFSRCTAIISLLVGAPLKVGFYGYKEEGLYRGNFLTHRVAYNPHFHISQNFSALLEAVGVDKRDEPLVKLPMPRERERLPRVDVESEVVRAREQLARLYPGFSSASHLVLLNPDPGLLALRGWGAERYATLADRILSEYPEVVVGVVGLERSSDYYRRVSEFVAHRERVINLCGVTQSMRELLGFFKAAAVLVTNDSGPAHFAPLVGLPTVTLFGPESPHRYEPLSAVNTSLYAQLSCSPCFSAQNHRQSVCRNNKCLQAITVDAVYDATVRWLSPAVPRAESGSLGASVEM